MAFFLKPRRLDAWRVRAESLAPASRLPHDIRAAFPWATSVILLAYPYAPFAPGERIGAYYIASNEAYAASKSLLAALQGLGARFERTELPMRALALSEGVGIQGRNGLLRIAPYGSRVALQALLTDACAPERYDNPAWQPCPDGCRACADACPSRAISPGGLDVSRCMRLYMERLPYPEFAYRHMQTHLGCEICQFACPFNAAVGARAVPEAVRLAFSLERLLGGDDADARALVGRNITRWNRLPGEAAIFASRDGVFPELVEAALDSPFPGARDAAAWALRHPAGP